MKDYKTAPEKHFLGCKIRIVCYNKFKQPRHPQRNNYREHALHAVRRQPEKYFKGVIEWALMILLPKTAQTKTSAYLRITRLSAGSTGCRSETAGSLRWYAGARGVPASRSITNDCAGVRRACGTISPPPNIFPKCASCCSPGISRGGPNWPTVISRGPEG